jgi:hypothetical protein
MTTLFLGPLKRIPFVFVLFLIAFPYCCMPACTDWQSQSANTQQNSSDLAVTMKFIQDTLNGLGAVNYIAHFHDNSQGKDSTKQFREEVSGAVADSDSCRIDFHYKLSIDGKLEKDTAFRVNLKDITSTIVEYINQSFNERLAFEGRSSLRANVVPEVFPVKVYDTSKNYYWFCFPDQELADRFAKAVRRAAELCVGRNKDETGSPSTVQGAQVQGKPSNDEARPNTTAVIVASKPPKQGQSTSPKSSAVQKSQQSSGKTAPLLVDTDDTCHFFIDDEDKGQITPDTSQKFPVGLGEHILKCKNDAIPDLVWRKVVDVKDTSQVAAVVSLKALHVQYNQAVSKVQNQKAEADAAAAKQLAEAQAEEKQREAAKTEFPKKIFDTVSGTWGIDIPVPPWCLNGICLDSSPITYRLTFKELTDRGILFSLQWEDRNVSKGNPMKGNRYEGYYNPSPPNRLRGIPFDCDRVTMPYDWTPCGSVDEGFAPGSVTILSQDQIELLYGDKRLVLTRK